MIKNIIALYLILAFAASASAQSVDTKKVNDLVAKKDFVAAISELNSLKKQVQELASAELQTAFPKSVGEFTLKPAEPMRSDMSGGLSLQLVYAKPTPQAKEGARDSSTAMAAMAASAPPMPGMGGDGNSFTVSVSTNVSMAFELMNAHSGGEGQPAMGDGTSEALRVKGYRALVKNTPHSGPTAQMLVGGAFIDVRAMGQKDDKIVRSFLEAINTDKLKSIVGE